MKHLKKILMFLLMITLAVSVPACKKTGNKPGPGNGDEPIVEPTDPDDPIIEPGEKLENWGDEILKGISVDLSKFVSLGMERRPNSVKNKPQPINFKVQEEEKENYMTTLSVKPKTNLMYKSLDTFVEEEIEDTVLVGATEDGEIEEVEFDVEEEFNIFKLLVQDDFTYITITPKTRDGIVTLNIEGDDEEFHQETMVVARTHPSIQNVIQNSMEQVYLDENKYVEVSTFDKSGYETDEVFQSYIIDNDTGDIFEFPQQLKDHKIYNNLLVDSVGIYDINDAINSDDYTMVEKYKFNRPDVDVKDIIIDKYENTYIINDKINYKPDVGSDLPYYIDVNNRDYDRMRLLTKENEVIVMETTQKNLTLSQFMRDSIKFIYGENFEELPIDDTKIYEFIPSKIERGNHSGISLFKIINGVIFSMFKHQSNLNLTSNGNITMYVTRYDESFGYYSISIVRKIDDGTIYGILLPHVINIGKNYVFFDADGVNINNLRYISINELYNNIHDVEVDLNDINRSGYIHVDITTISHLLEFTPFPDNDRAYKVISSNVGKPYLEYDDFINGEFKELVFALDEEGKPYLALKSEYSAGDKTEVELVPIG